MEAEKIVYVQWVPHEGLTHEERMAKVAEGVHHDYFGELQEVPPPEPAT